MAEMFPKFLVMVLSFQIILVENLRVDPSTEPEPGIIDIMEGEELEITCDTNTIKPDFIFDDIDFPLSLKNLSSELKLSSRNYKEKIYKKSTMLVGDSGWYRCKPFDRLVYLSVKSNAGYFVDGTVSPMPTLILNKNWKKIRYEKNVWISCKPKSSSYKVHLFKDGRPFKPSTEKVVLETNYLSVTDPGIYKCELRKDEQFVAMKEYNVTGESMREEMDGINNAFLFFGSEQKFTSGLGYSQKVYESPQLIIHKNKCSHARKTGEFRVNCSATHPYAHDMEGLSMTVPKWKISDSDIEFKTINYPVIRHPTFANYRITTTEITYTVSDDWTRDLICFIPNKYNPLVKTNISVIVNRPDFQGINLITDSPSSSRIVKSVDREMQFVVAIEAYPNQPEIIWRDPRGREIVSNENKFLIENNCEETKLKVSNLDLEDDGYYTVEATTSNPGSNKTLIFNLDIWENRFIKTLDNVAEYYLQNDFAKVDCIVDESRELNITWSFRQRPDFPLNSTPENMIIGSDQTTVSWKVQSSGYISCTVCEFSEDVPNECENVTRPIFMTDVPGGFGIISPSRMMMINETVELICAASIYHFTDKVEWLDESGIPLVVSDRVNVHLSTTKLSHQASLTFKSIDEIDNGTYVCRSTNIQGQVNKTSYTLRVYDLVKPYFIETNMNGSMEKNFYPMTNSEHIILECYAGGKPQPVVFWWKDGERINETDRKDTQVCKYSFQNNNQQLYVDNLDENCSALYQCQAKNSFGVIEARQYVTVKRIELPTPKETKLPPSDRSISLDVMAIVFVIFIVVIVCLGLSIFLWKAKRRTARKLEQMGQEDFREGTLDFLKHGLTSADQTQFLPYKELEFPKKNLEVKEELGSGSFGVVEIARAQDLFGKGTNWLVAVKKPNKKQDKYVSIKTLARELKIMIHLGKHLNVVNLLGACTKDIKNSELLVIIEYCAFGNLRNYLKNNGSEFISQIDAVTGKIDLSILPFTPNKSTEKRSSDSSNKISDTVDSSEKSLSSDAVDGGKEEFSNAVTDTAKAKCDRELGTDDTPSYYSGPPNQRKFADEEFLPLRTSTLLSWAFQVSNGMEYLRQRKVIHGDLAARNILLAKRNVVKISDFGLSKELHERDEYKKTTDGPLPFKWMAIETLRDGIFSTQSDVWSFGIVLWEFFELGEQPYLNIQKLELLEKLENGYRMEKPKKATEELYELMIQCWNSKPKSRPSFINFIDRIGSIMDQDERKRLEKLGFSYRDGNEKLWKREKRYNSVLMSSSNHDTSPPGTSAGLPTDE